jgi:hypothetical protein
MRQAKRLQIMVFSLFMLPPLIASSSDSSPNQQATEDWQQLERRINSLERKLSEKNKKFKVDGFISAAYARSDDSSTTENWGGITDKNDFGALSNIGVQMSFSPNPSTSITTQFIARGEEEWHMEAEWAYISFKASNQLTFRLGRQKAPLYLLSEYIEVGYANPWIYAPDEVYGITGDSTYNGVSALYNIPMGDWDTTLQAMWGNNAFSHPTVGSVSLDDLVSLSVTTRNEFITYRLGYSFLKGNIPTLSVPLPAIPNTPIVSGDTLSFSAQKSDITYLSAGAIYDNSQWLLMAELAQLEIEGWFTDTSGAYLMAGYRFGNLMPHFTVAKMEVQDHGARSVGTISSGNTILSGALVGAIADSLLVQNQSTYTLGLRFEVLPAVSAKMELSHITDFNGSNGQFSVSQPPTDDSVNIVKFSIDSVF